MSSESSPQDSPKAVDLAGSDILAAARQASRSGFVFGAVLVCLGIFAVMAPLFSGIATAVLVGMLLMFGGMIETAFAVRAPSFGKGALVFLFGGLGIAAGVMMLLWPGRGLGALTFVLVVYFLAAGIVDIILAFRVRPQEGWGWALFSGIVSVALAALIVAKWPVSGIWAVGVYVGVRLLMHGWTLMALGVTGRDALEYLQDNRLEALERHVRAGLGALQEAQVALVGHTAMLLALDNELRKKASTSDIDPAIRGLNTQLGAAREKMQETTEAGAEAWSVAQDEANKAFDALRKNAAEVSAKLQKELGIDKA